MGVLICPKCSSIEPSTDPLHECKRVYRTCHECRVFVDPPRRTNLRLLFVAAFVGICAYCAGYLSRFA